MRRRQLLAAQQLAAPCGRRPLHRAPSPIDKERDLARPQIRKHTHAMDETIELTIGPSVAVDPVLPTTTQDSFAALMFAGARAPRNAASMLNARSNCKKRQLKRRHHRARPMLRSQHRISVQSSSLVSAPLHRLHFYVVLRKLIAKLQAFSQSIQETSVVRFYSPIDADDEMLSWQVICDGAFHWIPHPNRCRRSNEEPNASAVVPTGKS